MKIRVLLYLPKEQEEIMVEVPENESSINQANFIANTIEQQYPDYYRWGTLSYVIDWPIDKYETNTINAK